MPITVNLNTGAILSAPELDEATRKQMRLAVARAFLGLHPEVITNAVAEYQKEAIHD